MLKPHWMSEEEFENFKTVCYLKAQIIQSKNTENSLFNVDDIFKLTDLIIKIELEKLEKEFESDSYIDYNDEIVSIEEIGVLETIDISVTGDNLFYCNGVLTKNSWGVPQSCDLLIALISTPELEELCQILVKQLKNRYNGLTYLNKFVIGIDRAKMRLYDVENSAHDGLSSSSPPSNRPANVSKFKDFK